MDITVLETPGHTPGSVCFYAEKEGILFSGDTLFFDGVGRTDLPGGSEKKLKESIQRKIAVLPPETRVFPGHGPFTTVEREKRGNVFFRETVQEQRPEPAVRAIPALVSLHVSEPAVLVKTPKPVAKTAQVRARTAQVLARPGRKTAPKPAKRARPPAKPARSAKKSAGKSVKSIAK